MGENRRTGDYGEEVEMGHQLCDSKSFNDFNFFLMISTKWTRIKALFQLDLPQSTTDRLNGTKC